MSKENQRVGIRDNVRVWLFAIEGSVLLDLLSETKNCSGYDLFKPKNQPETVKAVDNLFNYKTFQMNYKNHLEKWNFARLVKKINFN